MSLDVYLEAGAKSRECVCGQCGHAHTNVNVVEVYNANITHNLGKMAQEAGLYTVLWRPEELGFKKAQKLIPPLVVGLIRLKREPERFASYNPSNGWGDYAGLVGFIENYLAACRAFPDADVRVSR